MILYHAGFEIIKEPDIHHGRKNADFGQGFYTTSDEEFAKRWARSAKGSESIVNKYELDTEALTIKRFERDAEWFEYIYGNRNLKPDKLAADVIIGPIANDTIFNTLGITTGGFLEPEEAMQLLWVGPEYTQVTLKTEAAVSHLKWLGSYTLSFEELDRYKEQLIDEEKEYQSALARQLTHL
ncbi:MAG: DUF3990 domain-containing protein [Lachnospiraceae bacterium]|nr:DUF3990 domain-containing protein [Lachnospiraceae bacterium]